MTKEIECPDYGTDYDAKDEECQECAVAGECEAATKKAEEEAKPDFPSPKKKQKLQAMSQCFW